MKQKNAGRISQADIIDAANKTGIDASYLRALLSLAWRGYEVTEPNTVLAWFTPFRCLALSKESDEVISAWTVGTLEVSGKVNWFAIYLGDVPAATNVASTMTRAKAIISEVMVVGSRAAPLIGKAQSVHNGEPFFLYSAPGLVGPVIQKRLASFVERNDIAIIGATKATPRKPRKAA